MREKKKEEMTQKEGSQKPSIDQQHSLPTVQYPAGPPIDVALSKPSCHDNTFDAIYAGQIPGKWGAG